MKDSIELSKSYSSLFSLPSLWEIIVGSIAYTLIYSFFDVIALKLSLIKTLEYLITLCFIYFLLNLSLTALTLLFIGEERRILDFRRLVGLYTISMALGGLLHFIGAIIFFINHNLLKFFIFFEILGISISLSYIFLSLSAIINVGFFKPGLLGVAWSTLMIYIKYVLYRQLSTFSTQSFIGISFVSLMLFISVSLITVIAIDSLGKGKNVHALDAFRGFMAVWLSRDNSVLEKFLDQIGEFRDIIMGWTVFRRKKDDSIKAAWIISNIHPGPFLNAGSANITSFVAEKLERSLGAEAVSLLHGTCSHYNNLVSSNEKERIYLEFKKILNKCTDKKGVSMGIRFADGKIELYSQMFGDLILSISTCNDFSMDDLSYELGLVAHEIYKKYGFNGILVDSHNSIDKNNYHTPADIKPWKPLGKRILTLIERTMESHKDFTEKTFNASLGTHKIRCSELTVKDGLGSDGVAFYSLDVGGKKYGYLILDSNNLKTGLRERIREYIMKNFNYDEAEVLTTDTHEVNAVSTKEGSYPILDEKNLSLLLKCIDKAIRKAEDNMEEVYVCSGLEIVGNVKVWGDENYYFLKNLLYHGLVFFKCLYNAGLALASVILGLLVLFLL
ncbi:MAG: DUF2070 family protein [Candidatus Njordarchaeia archaeon]